MTHHSEFRQGQRVIVFLKDGTKVVGKYLGKTSKFIDLEGQSVPRENIRQISIYRSPNA